MPLLALLNRLLMEGPTAGTSASKWRANPIRIYHGSLPIPWPSFKFKREGMTNSSSANWIYDMLLFHIVLLLWIALVWTKTTTYWVSVNIIVLRYVEVSLRSINTYLWAFVQEPCVGSPSEEDFPPHYEVEVQYGTSKAGRPLFSILTTTIESKFLQIVLLVSTVIFSS